MADEIATLSLRVTSEKGIATDDGGDASLDLPSKVKIISLFILIYFNFNLSILFERH